jgi:predicted NAD-dependent protein-ADP-ribosyltransferase YbiA (DUF1768 family)
MKPLIIAYYDGDPEVRVLSNFAKTPFDLDGREYQTVEGFWQALKADDPILRQKIASCVDGLDARQLGRKAATARTLFTYQENLYVVGSPQHHILMERAVRAKVAQNEDVEKALWASGTRPLKHMLKTRHGTWKPGDSAALPAVVFEQMLIQIRDELQRDMFDPELPLPNGVNTGFDDIYA